MARTLLAPRPRSPRRSLIGDTDRRSVWPTTVGADTLRGMSRHACRDTYRRDARHDAMFGCHVVRVRDSELLSRVALDLSAGGMQVLTGEKVLTGELVMVTFRAPQSEKWFTLRGTVARVLHGRRPNEWGRRLGIAFDDPGSERANLVAATRLLDPGRARRRASAPSSGAHDE